MSVGIGVASVGLVLLMASCNRSTGPTSLPPLPPFTAACTEDSEELFAAAPEPTQGTLPRPGDNLVRRRFVYVKRELLIRPQEPGTMLRLNLFEDLCLDAFFAGRQPPIFDSFHWGGRVKDQRLSSVSFTYQNEPEGGLSGGVGGLLGVGDRAYEIFCSRNTKGICNVDEVRGTRVE